MRLRSQPPPQLPPATGKPTAIKTKNCQGSGTYQRHHAGDGVYDRLRHLYCVRGNRAGSELAGVADLAWVVTGFLTIVGALCYGELAAMMPRAGGQYVYLREALGPLWGFLYGWTLFLVIQTGTIAAVGVAFGKFLGIFIASVSSSNWVLHFGKVPPIYIGPMVLGNMDVGLNTQNLVAILVVVALSVINIFGVKTGALIQNIFTTAKVSALLGVALLGLFIGRNAQAVAANFHGNFWNNAGLGAQHAVQVGVGGPC